MQEHAQTDIQPKISDEEEAVASALTQVLEILRKLGPEGRKRVIDTLVTFFQMVKSPSQYSREDSVSSSSPASFTEDRSLSPKEFLLEKDPKTDVEKVACLGFYLTHYRGMPHFKTIDISKLNTEAAQIKFSNAAVSVNNATLQNYLTGAGKGTKQLSAFGERFVLALPDREAAKVVMSLTRQRRRNRRSAQPDALPDDA
ncbi:MAG: hypothetical protein ACRETL_09955 [Gammaproteobacteria bacterium]